LVTDCPHIDHVYLRDGPGVFVLQDEVAGPEKARPSGKDIDAESTAMILVAERPSVLFEGALILRLISR